MKIPAVTLHALTIGVTLMVHLYRYPCNRLPLLSFAFYTVLCFSIFVDTSRPSPYTKRLGSRQVQSNMRRRPQIRGISSTRRAALPVNAAPAHIQVRARSFAIALSLRGKDDCKAAPVRIPGPSGGQGQMICVRQRGVGLLEDRPL